MHTMIPQSCVNTTERDHKSKTFDLLMESVQTNGPIQTASDKCAICFEQLVGAIVQCVSCEYGKVRIHALYIFHSQLCDII